MPNELIWIIFLLTELCAAVILLRAFGKTGLYALIVMNVILCNIQVQKMVTMVGLTFTLGNVLYGAIFFATDLLSELYGKREARRAVWLGFVVMVVSLVAMLFAVEFVPTEDAIPKHSAMQELFGSFGSLVSVSDVVREISFARIVVASFIAYLISQFHDVWAFHFWKDKTGGRHLWLRNNASTMVSQLLDSCVFCSLAFAGALPREAFFQVLLTTYFIKLVVAALDTPFVYLGRRLASGAKAG
ncbi:MAG: queuosine precursor transporter [Verrucomicrobia bacterium]|nr:queuosine precursor transporter [Verrucomicrobiota bacterium]